MYAFKLSCALADVFGPISGALFYKFELVPDGYIIRRRGAGTFVVQLLRSTCSRRAGQGTTTGLTVRARLAYVTPAHQHPLGYEMSLERRPIASLQGIDASGRVIYVGTEGHLARHLRNARTVYDERRIAPGPHEGMTLLCV